jgi:hypothetical protein
VGEAVTAAQRVPGGDGAPHQVAGDDRLRPAGLVDQLVEPRQDRAGVESGVTNRRGAVAREVGDDDPVGPDQVRNNPDPDGCELTLAVQQHDRRAVTAFQHGGGHTRQHQLPLGHRHGVQQLVASLVASGPLEMRCAVLAAHHGLLSRWLRGKGPRLAAASASVASTNSAGTCHVGISM